MRRVLTNIFGKREVLAYVTSQERDSGSRRLFFSTVFPKQLQVFCAWQEKSPLNQTGSGRMQFIPLMLYVLNGRLKSVITNRKLSGHYAVTCSAAVKGLKLKA